MSWHAIWRHKGTEPHTLDGSAEDILRTLLKLDGYDSKTASMSLDDWHHQLAYIADTLALRSTDTVYEVGCGAGAVLYSLQPKCKVGGGLDYSESLLRTAQQVLASQDLQ